MGCARRKAPRAGVDVGLAAIVLGALACSGSQPAARGFGSTELEPTRDSTVELYSQNGLGILEYTTGNPAVWWTLDLVTGAVQSYGASRPPIPTPVGTTTTPPPQPYTCNGDYTQGGPVGTFTLQITDTATNVETDIDDVVSYPICPGADGMLAVFVVNTSGGIVLEAGPYTQLEPVELTVGVLAIVSWDGATATTPPTGVTVLAAPVTAPDQDELDSIELSTGYYNVTTVIPAVPVSPAWATGATPLGSLQSTSLAGSASTIEIADGHYIYPRAISGGGSAMFAGPFASGPASELALFELPAGTPLPSASEVYPAPGSLQALKRAVFTWQVDGSAASQLVVWDDTDLMLTTCPSVPGAYLGGVWSPDQSKVLFSVPEDSFGSVGSYPSPGGLLDLLALGAPGGTASCQQLAASEVVNAAFSPDGDFIFWLSQPPTGEAQLFTAASDGSGARMVGAGEINEAHFISDGGARLEMILGGELAWLDLHDATGTLHHVAEQVHGSIYDITGGHWLIMGSEWSTADGTGTLALINRDDSEVRPISLSVSQYEVLVDEIGSDGGLVVPGDDAAVGVEFIVVYVVRGRNPSPQDGIWRATLTPSELQ